MKQTALRILLVEDDENILLPVCELLETMGHTVTAVSRAEEATPLLRTQEFDLLFTDVSLPGKSGIELAHQAVQDVPGLRVIIASGHGANVDIGAKGPLDSAVLLPKPYGLSQIEQALAQAMA